MDNFDQLKEKCVVKNDELINQFIQYKEESGEHEEDAFKSWVIQKLSLNETVLSNFNEQQQVIVNFLSAILNQIEENQKALINLKKAVQSTKNSTAFLESIEKLEPLFFQLTDNKEDITRFLNEPRDEWVGLTPLDMIHVGKEEAVENLLNRLVYGDPIS